MVLRVNVDHKNMVVLEPFQEEIKRKNGKVLKVIQKVGSVASVIGILVAGGGQTIVDVKAADNTSSNTHTDTVKENKEPNNNGISRDDFSIVGFDDLDKDTKKIFEEIFDKSFNKINMDDLYACESASIDKRIIPSLDFLEFLPKLKRLSIYDSTINNTDYLKYKHLDTLSLWNCSITDKDILNFPRSLTSLSLEQSFLILSLDNLPELCPNLESLDVDQCAGLTNLDFIKQLGMLKSFEASNVMGTTQELLDYLNKNSIKTNINAQDILNNDKIEKIISEIITDEMDDSERLQAVVSYVISNMDYKKSLSRESNEEPLTYGLNGKGVCASYAYLTSVLLNSAGINSFEITSTKHAWNLVELDGKYYYVDTTNMRQVPFLTKFLLDKANVGFFYKQGTKSNALSLMKDIRSDKININEDMEQMILALEKDKDFIQKHCSNGIVDMVVIMGILIGLGFLKENISLGNVRSRKSKNR